jgi:HTH-type transcriptional repressor of NAD biosynthesis genes
MSPAIQPPFLRTILFLGAESTGKSTIMRALSQIYQCPGIHEFGRELAEERSGKLTLEDHTEIGRIQIEREDAALESHQGMIFCDTSPLSTLFYSRAFFGDASEELVRMANRSYDLVFLCEPDFPMERDAIRADEEFRLKQHQWYVDELSNRSIHFESLQGSLEQRIEKAKATIENYFQA